MIERLRQGDWLSRERVNRIAVLSALGCVLTLLIWLVAAGGPVDAQGRPVGTDFSAFWTAGWLANHGHANDAWDIAAHTATMRTQLSDQRVGPTPWFYPPPFLLVASPLAHLPYIPALIVWQAVSLAAMALALRQILPDWRAALVALASPFTLAVLGHGQNAYLSAALVGAGLVLVHRNAATSGSLFGALVYKPQLGLLLGPYLLVQRRPLVLLSAVASAMLLIGVSTLIWGVATWHAFLGSLHFARTQILEAGAVPYFKSGSLFGAMRLWNAPVALAYTLQAIGAASALFLIWRTRRAALPVRSAAACAAIALWTPYVQDYDLAIVGVGAAFVYALASQAGSLAGERTALALIWAQPMVARPLAQYAAIPTGPVIAVLLAVLVLRRTRDAADITASPSRHSRAASAP